MWKIFRNQFLIEIIVYAGLGLGWGRSTKEVFLKRLFASLNIGLADADDYSGYCFCYYDDEESILEVWWGDDDALRWMQILKKEKSFNPLGCSSYQLNRFDIISHNWIIS